MSSVIILHSAQLFPRLQILLSGHDIYTSNGDIPPHTTKYNLTGLYPDTDTRFYANVVAYNQAGLHTVATSDGCEIDDDKPVAGVVYDGKGMSYHKIM